LKAQKGETVMMEAHTLWTMRDGRQIAIREMSDTHLVNAIRMIERRVPAMADAMRVAAEGFASYFGGDTMASYYAERDADYTAQATDITLVLQ